MVIEATIERTKQPQTATTLPKWQDLFQVTQQCSRHLFVEVPRDDSLRVGGTDSCDNDD